MKIKIGDTVYDAAALDELSLRMILRLEQETTDFGHPIRMSDIQRISTEIDALKTDRERAEHPEAIWLTAVVVWAARKLAGEDVTFEQAVDFPIASLTYLAEPSDHLEPANPTRPRSRKGSGVAGKPRPTSATKTSGPVSIAG